jgi:hypothetical protein
VARVRAFGVDLQLSFNAPALIGAAVDHATDPTTVEVGDFKPPAGEGRPLAWLPDGRGGALVEVREHPDAGILVDAGHFGRFLIRPDARLVRCAPGEGDWQRVLVAQVLPLVAGLRGLHVIHASAVALGDGAVAFAGASGAGKSTLAAELARAGHPMIAEDVLALRLEQGTPIAEPGISLPGLPRAPRALPLRTLYLLGEAGEDPPSPRDLMATSFVPWLSADAGQLELAAAVAGSVTVARVERDAESANRPAAFIRA